MWCLDGSKRTPTWTSATCSRFPRIRLLCWSRTGVAQDVTASLVPSGMDINCNKQWNKLNSRIIIHLKLLSQLVTVLRTNLQKRSTFNEVCFSGSCGWQVKIPNRVPRDFTCLYRRKDSKSKSSKKRVGVCFEPGFGSSFRLAPIHLHIAQAAYCVTEGTNCRLTSSSLYGVQCEALLAPKRP